jgi:hypothetical protein
MTKKLLGLRGLESISLALLLAPEPFTTPVGLAMLTAIRTYQAVEKRKQEEMRERCASVSFDDYYQLDVKQADGKLKYNVEPLASRSGLLQHEMANPKMIENRAAWQQYQKRGCSYVNTKSNASYKGLLPQATANRLKLYETGAWQQYRKGTYNYLNRDTKAISGNIGLLPRTIPHPIKLYENDDWKQLHGISSNTNKNTNSVTAFSGLQRGLLAGKKSLNRKDTGFGQAGGRKPVV